MAAVSVRDAAPLTQRSGDTLSGRRLCLAVTGLALISRVAQHPPHGRSLPASFPRSCRNPPLIQRARNRVDAEPLLRVNRKHHPDHVCFAFPYFVISGCSVSLPSIPVALRTS